MKTPDEITSPNLLETTLPHMRADNFWNHSLWQYLFTLLSKENRTEREENNLTFLMNHL